MTTSTYVAGTFGEATGTSIDVFDPSDGSTLATIPSATPDEVTQTLAAARAAQPGWARTPAAERGRHLRAMADLIAANGPELAALIVSEVGKPIAQALGEVAFAEGFLRYNAEWDRRLEGEILPGDVAGETVHLLREPIGVVVAICPWNFPLAVLCRKLGPALVTGNTVVVKPSEISPLATLRLFELIDQELDLPAGVVNLVCGAGPTGEALVKSPLTGLVSFTGHRDTGKAVMVAAAANLTRVSLELGGKAPAIVAADADLETAIPAIVAARHLNAGQVCTSAERVFVDARIADEFTEGYVRAVEALRIGDPTTGVDMGPMVSAAQLSKTQAAVALAIEEGAQVVTGGGRPDGEAYANDGYWHAPTVLTGVSPAMSVMREETFGPVTPILGYDDVEQAVTLANDSRYGLSAYIYSRNYHTVMRTVADLEFGEIYINRTNGESIHAHHAGYKESGMGGEDGKWGLLRYTQIKTAYHHHG